MKKLTFLIVLLSSIAGFAQTTFSDIGKKPTYKKGDLVLMTDQSRMRVSSVTHEKLGRKKKYTYTFVPTAVLEPVAIVTEQESQFLDFNGEPPIEPPNGKTYYQGWIDAGGYYHGYGNSLWKPGTYYYGPYSNDKTVLGTVMVLGMVKYVFADL